MTPKSASPKSKPGASAPELAAALADVVQVTRHLAEQVQQISIHLERETTRLPDPSELPLVLSELSELHHRLGKIAAPAE